MSQIQLAEITVDIQRKDIKNVHLCVFPPDGRVKVSAPHRMNLDVLRVFLISKLSWIRKQQQKFKQQERESERYFIERESHYFRGKRYLLTVIEEDAKPRVILKHSEIELYIRPNTSQEKRRSIMDEWYRSELKKQLPTLIKKWEKRIGVQAKEVKIRLMRTKWGACNIDAKRIWLNLELAKKPKACLEYVIVHELVHLLERKHNDAFIKYMDTFMPKWRFYRDELNELPFRYVEWFDKTIK